MLVPQKIELLKTLIAAVRKDLPDLDNLGFAFQVSGEILQSFLGAEWIATHIQGDTAPTNFFRNGARGPDVIVGMVRVINLAEMLLNLQNAPEFKGVLTKLKTDNVESAYAELDVAKLLVWRGVRFRFNSPSEEGGERGKDYDLKLLLPSGRLVCADTKCRLEGQEPDEDKLLRLLKDNVDQLPENEPGAFFVKVPQTWSIHKEAERFAPIFHRAVKRLAGISDRVIAVVFYGSPTLVAENGGSMSPMIAIEVENLTHRFDTSLDWNILKEDDPETPPQSKSENWLDLMAACNEASQ